MRIYLDSFHRSKGDIGEELGGSGGRQVKISSVKEGVFLSHSVSVKVLEDFVETELASSLHRVTDESWRPSSGQSFDASLGNSDLKTRTGHLSAKSVITLRPLPKDGYFAASTCIRHLTKSNGTTAVWVKPQERAPPIIHFK